MEWIRRNKDWLIASSIFISFIFLAVFSGFFGGNGQPKEKEIHVEEEVSIDIAAENQSAQSSAAGQQSFSSAQNTSFFLRPGPSELLSKLSQMEPHELRSEAKELPGLKVMWPAYFFSVASVEKDTGQLIFDASEDGFGALIQAEISTSQYPQIISLERGTKVWLAGEIQGVDVAGTGQFSIKVEYVRFDDFKPSTSTKKNSPEPSASTEGE